MQELFDNVEEICLKLKSDADTEKEALGIAMLELLDSLKKLSVSELEIQKQTELVGVQSEVIVQENRNMKLTIQTLLGIIRTEKSLINQIEVVGIVSQAETFLQGF